ncbi:MAG: TfoX/Sxy family protein [Pseudomarimonas sp.]
MAAPRGDKMMNVGPKSAAWLRQVGIRSREELLSHGAVGAFVKIKRAGFRPSLNLLYALEGALLECHWQQLPEARRGELVTAVEAAVALFPTAKGRAAGAVVERSGAQFEADSNVDGGDASGSDFGLDDPAAEASDGGAD